MMLLLITTFSLALVSCGDEKDEPEIPASTIVNGVDISLLPGDYVFGGNIAPHFSLYEDGSCETYSTGASTSHDTGSWTYDTESKILVLRMDRGVNHTYTVKSLSENSITAEWSSVKYGNFTSSWNRKDLAEMIDESLLPGKYTYSYSYSSQDILTLYKDGRAFSGHLDNNSDRYTDYGNGTWTYDATRRLLEVDVRSNKYGTQIGDSIRVKSLTPTSLVGGDVFYGHSTKIYTREKWE